MTDEEKLLSFLGYKREWCMNTGATGTGGLEWWGAQCAIIRGKAMREGRLEGANSYVEGENWGQGSRRD